jgi:predicted MFS family arabinose efflux permease
MRPVPAPAPPGTAHAHTDGAASAAELAALALAYGLAGFGYIVTATYLPVIARTAVPGSAWLDLFWPIFGVGVVAGALWSTRWRRHGDARWLLSAAYLVQAGGIGLGLWMPRAAGLALGSLLLGMPFTAITLFVLQEVRRQRPRHAASGIGLLTAMFGIGQIAGPAMVSRVLQHSATRALGFDRALQLAIGALLLGAGLHAWAALAHPMRRA